MKKPGIVLHRESRSFDKQKLARDWALRREVELQDTLVYSGTEYLPISTVIERYLKEFQPSGRSINFDLNKLLSREITKVDAHSPTAKDLIKHVRARHLECMPQTAANDLIWIGQVFKPMKV